ncbi:MAG: sulfite exporter TauE/SafE family protein [Methanomassiliicoccales archaeon]|nr:sulfite exporter TauE/SafE family protein [Methanomassiliicoccales archaeon]NYT14410.1 sulfite exporter TauE/SafE family protein [Methanomassiliicoccales archaeon]
MDIIIFAGILIMALLAGILGSLLGLGGGVIIIPGLVLIFGLPIQEAIGASLVAVIATSTGAATYYVREGISNIRLGMVLETATTLGSAVGALLAIYTDQSLLAVAFAALLVYSAIHMIRRPERLATFDEKAPGFPELSASYLDKNTGEEVSYCVRHIPRGLIASFFAGNMSGLLGVGGGTIKVPVMNIWMGVPLKAAAATSNFMIGVTALAGALVYYASGSLSPVVSANVAVGVFFGALVGSRVAHLARSEYLRTTFALVLMVIAILMILYAAGVISAL